MLSILFGIIVFCGMAALIISIFRSWSMHSKIPIKEILLCFAVMMTALFVLPLVRNIDEDLVSWTAEISRVTVTNTETNETLFVAEGNLSVHASGTNSSTWGFLGFFSSNTSSNDSYLTITIKTGKDANLTYKIRLSEKITYFVETIDQSPDDPYYYRVTNNISQLRAENEL